MLIQGRLRKRLRHPHGWCCRQTAWPAVFVAAAASSFLKDVGGQKSARRIRFLQQIRRFRATAEFRKDYARWCRTLLAQQNIESSVFFRCRDRLPSNVIRGEPSSASPSVLSDCLARVPGRFERRPNCFQRWDMPKLYFGVGLFESVRRTSRGCDLCNPHDSNWR